MIALVLPPPARRADLLQLSLHFDGAEHAVRIEIANLLRALGIQLGHADYAAGLADVLTSPDSNSRRARASATTAETQTPHE